ncbi:MAG: tryptophanyl-tRNA ligase [Candidatus Uhrbacteria bacterium GW2011_GWB1_41_7]|nr:MAG: tryptophanyl-tRNA ligase [Candidatus Uhrbacteria bacterium GW2011_GWB1_41_7]
MSKSAASAKSYISLMDDPDLIHKKIRSAVTDSQQLITFDESREGLYNLLTIFSLATGRPADEIANEYIEKGMKELKDNLSEVLCSYLLPIQTKMKKLLGDKQELTRIINNGSASAKKVADAKLKEVKKKIGVIL